MDCYFVIHIKERYVHFVFEGTDSQKNTVSKENSIIKFDDVFSLAEEMSNLSSENKLSNNIFAQIFYKVLSGSKSIDEIKHCFAQLTFYIVNGFDINVAPSLLTTNNKIVYKKGKPRLFINMDNGFESFVYCFVWAVKNSNLHVFRCANCGRFYFNTSDRKYCTSSECQHIKLLEYNRKLRKKRQTDIYIKLIDSYHAYTRHLRRMVKLIRVNEDDLQYFESENKKCDRIVTPLINKYRTEQKPVDDELNKIIHENRAKLSNIKDKLWKKYSTTDIE